MCTNSLFGTGRNLAVMVIAGLIAVFPASSTPSAYAQTTRTWDGQGDDNYWRTAANWGGTEPSAGDRLAFGGIARLTPYNDFDPGTSFRPITFNSGAGAFTLEGYSITLAWYGTHDGIENSSSNLQTINLDLLLPGERWFLGSGDMRVGGVISNASGGTGSVTMKGSGTLTLAGANTYTGDTVVSDGTLELANPLALQNSALNYNNQGGTFSFGTLTAATLGGLKGSQDLPTSVLTELTLDLPSGRTASYAGVINDGAGGMALVKTGPGTQVLTGNNTYTGGTTISAGALRISHNNALGTTDAETTVASGARLELHASDGDITVTGESLRITGSGGAAGSYAGALQSTSGSNTWAGSVTIVGTDTRIGAAAEATLTISGIIDCAGLNRALHIRNAGGTVVLSGENTYGGNTEVMSGTLRLGAHNSLPTGTILRTGWGSLQGTFDLYGYDQQIAGLNRFGNHANNFVTNSNADALSTLTVHKALAEVSTYEGQITGNLALTKAGGGTLTLSGNNTHTGETVILAGKLELGNALALQNSPLNYDNQGGTIDFGSLASVTLGGMKGAQNLPTANLTTLTLNPAAGSVVTYTGTIADGSAGILALVKTGAGTQVLAGENSYTGTTTVSAGALRITSPTALGTTAGGTTVASGAQLELAGGITVTGESITISGEGNNFSGGLQSQSGHNTWAGPVTLGASNTRIGANGVGQVLTVSGVIGDGGTDHTLIVRNADGGTTILSGQNTYGGGTNVGGILKLDGGHDRLPVGTVLQIGFALSGTFDLNGYSQTVAGLTRSGSANVVTNSNNDSLSTLTVNTADGSSFTYGTTDTNGRITGNLALTKAGGGTLALRGNNTHTGETVILDGTLQINHALALQNSPLNYDNQGGTIDFGSLASVTLGGMKGAQNLPTADLMTLTLNPAAGSVVTYTGTIADGSAGSLALVKTGAGTQVLAGENSYTGTTTVSAGALRITSPNALGTTAGGTTVAGGARLELSGDITVAGEAITISGDGANSFGALQSQNGDNTWAGPVTLGADNTRIGATAGSTLRISGDIDDGGQNRGLTIRNESSDATVVLSGNNTYGNGTRIYSGTLQLGAHDSLPTGAWLPIGSDTLEAKFDLAGFNQTTGTLESVGTHSHVITNNGPNASTLTITQNSSQTFSGQITNEANALNLIKSGSGTLTLSGDNSYTGTTTVSNGRLTIAHSNALGTTAGGTTVAGGATLALQGGITVEEAITSIGTGGSVGTILNISGDNRLNGNIAKAGVTRFQSDAGLLTIGGNVGGNDNSVVLAGSGDGRILGNMSPGWNLFKEGSGTWTVEGSIGTLNGNHLAVQGGMLVLAGSNTYARPTNVSAGTLLVNGSTAAASTVTVHAGATLGGTGSIGGATTIRGGDALSRGGALSPGDTHTAAWSIGRLSFGNSLSLDDGAVWEWEFLKNTADNYDQVAGPTLILPTDPDAAITLNITGLAGHSVNWYDEFVLFTGQVENFNARMFDLVNDSSWDRGWAISVGNSLILTAVPEPGAWLMLLGMLVCGLLVRRRR